MPKNKYDVAYKWSREGMNGESRNGWATIGVAYLNDSGNISIKLNSLPIPGLESSPGDIMLFPKDENENDYPKDENKNDYPKIKSRVTKFAGSTKHSGFDEEPDSFSKEPEPPF
jgi:hypothetical protein